MGHPIVAALYDRMLARAEHAGLADRRAELLADASGEVLEIGAGTGLNLARYPATPERLVLTEPDPHMARRLRDRVAADPPQFPVEVVEAPAEELPFADDSFDTVVSTLVLCTVASPPRAAAEIARVLRPGGELLPDRARPRPGIATPRPLPGPARAPLGLGRRLLSSQPRHRARRSTAAGFDTAAITPGEFDAAGPLVKPLISGSARPPDG